MKKLTNVLLAGIIVVFMSGCNEEDPVANSVALADLGLGYKLTGTGGLNDQEVESFVFCGSIETVTYSTSSYSGTFTGTFYEVNGNVFKDDELYVQIDTEADATPGRFEEGATYVGRHYNDGYILENRTINEWTITSIEKVQCDG